LEEVVPVRVTPDEGPEAIAESLARRIDARGKIGGGRRGSQF
jgi:hypothetical protein